MKISKGFVMAVCFGLVAVAGTLYYILKSNQPNIQNEQRKLLTVRDQKLVQSITKKLTFEGSQNPETVAIRKLLYVYNVAAKLEKQSDIKLKKNWERESKRLLAMGVELKNLNNRLSDIPLSQPISKRLNRLSKLLTLEKIAENPKKALSQIKNEANIKLSENSGQFNNSVTAPGMKIDFRKIPESIVKVLNESADSSRSSSSFSYNETDPSTRTCKHSVLSDPLSEEEARSASDLFTERTIDVKDLALKLQTATAVLSYVRDQIKFFPTFGATQTASQVIRSGIGTRTDKATLLIALLRELEFPAVYLMGEILIEEVTLKRLFGVQGNMDLFWALTGAVGGYYLNEEGQADAGLMVYRKNGKRLWAFPHVWVKVFIDGSWIQLDPTNIQGDADVSLLARDLAVEVDLNQYFFGKDAQDRFVKPGTLVDELMRRAGSLQSSRSNTNVSRLHVKSENEKKSLNSNAENLVVGTIGLGEPCIEQQSVNILDEYQYKSEVLIKSGGQELISYQAPLALFRKETVALSHSAGLLNSVGNSVPGNLQLKVGQKIVASASILTGANIEPTHRIKFPQRFRELAVERVSGGQKSGGVILFNHFFASIFDQDIHDELEHIRQLKSENASDQVIMVRMLRLSALLAKLREDEDAKDLELLHGVSLQIFDLLLTFTNEGKIVDKLDKILGFVPVGTSIDWISQVFIYSRFGNFTDINNYLNILPTRNETLISNSALEHQIWEILFGVPGVSSVAVSQKSAKIDPGQDFIRGEQLGVGNDDFIFSRFQEEMQGQISNITDPQSEFIEKKSKLYSITRPLDLPSGWRGLGYLVIATRPDVGILASFTTLRPGFGSSGGGSEGSSEDNEEEPVGTGSNSPDTTTGGTACGNPVNIATGSMWHKFTDFSLLGRTRATNLNFERTYLTKAFSVAGDFGPPLGA